ncbi:MAG: hypothetical protein IT165_06815 [Bryobacterales bacterium]|nr:hypothetical protein [Bryobacterales bacterium]
MDRHLRMIGILNAGLGILGVLVCILLLIIFRGPGGILLINARIGGSATTMEGFVTMCVMVYLLIMAGPLIAVGYGLMNYQEWARNLGMILSIFTLVHVPLGTVVAIYSLWVLTSFEVEPLFKAPPGPPQDYHHQH